MSILTRPSAVVLALLVATAVNVHAADIVWDANGGTGGGFLTPAN